MRIGESEGGLARTLHARCDVWKRNQHAQKATWAQCRYVVRTDRFLMTIFWTGLGATFLATGLTTTFFTTGFGAGLTGAAFATTFGAGLATTLGAAFATTFGAGLATTFATTLGAGFGSGLATAFVAAGLAATTTFFTGATAFLGATATVFAAAFAGAFFPTAKVIGVGVNAEAEPARIANTANFMVIIIIYNYDKRGCEENWFVTEINLLLQTYPTTMIPAPSNSGRRSYDDVQVEYFGSREYWCLASYVTLSVPVFHIWVPHDLAALWKKVGTYLPVTMVGMTKCN